MVRLAVRTRSALMCAVRPKTAPNDRLRTLGGGGGCGCATPSVLSFSESGSDFPASLRQSLPRWNFAEAMSETGGGGVEGVRGELPEDGADADSEERDEGEGDVESAVSLWRKLAGRHNHGCRSQA